MFNKLKRDFTSVRDALRFTLNRKVPTWVCVLFYMIMLPIGLLMYPFAKIWSIIILRRIKREIGF